MIFRGRLMKDSESLEAHRIEPGNVIHLIANLETERGHISEEEPSISLHRAGSFGSRSPVNQPQLGNAAEIEIMSTILGTLGNCSLTVADQSLNRRNYHCRMLQQRMNGFQISRKESLLIMNQNIQTIDQLMEANTEIKPDQISSNPLAFDLKKRYLKLGQWVDVKDTVNQWVKCVSFS